MLSCKRPHGNIGPNHHGNYGSSENNGSKGAFGSKVSWGHPNDAKANFKSPSKSHISDKKAKFNTSCFKLESKNYDSWNKAKDKLTTEEYKSVAGQILALTMVRQAENSRIVINRSPSFLRVV
jgi:hypothetical protein